MERLFLTQEGFDKLKEELAFLQGPKRREIIRAIQVARDHGDLSENAEYDAAKEEQAKLELRISQLQSQLAKAQVIDKANIPEGKISLGQQVRLQDLNSQEEIFYALVAPEESDFENNRISVTSPLAGDSLVKKSGKKLLLKYQRELNTIKSSLSKLPRPRGRNNYQV